jgi:hypothetical protein
VAAISDFEKTAEDDERVTYRCGFGGALDHSFAILKVSRRLAEDAGPITFAVQLAASGVLRGYRQLGYWPERGAGVT